MMFDSKIHVSGELPRLLRNVGCHLLMLQALLLIDWPFVPIVHHQLSLSFSCPASHAMSFVPSTFTSHSNVFNAALETYRLKTEKDLAAVLQQRLGICGCPIQEFSGQGQLIRNTKPALRAGAIGGDSPLRVRGFPLQVYARRKYPRSPDKNELVQRT